MSDQQSVYLQRVWQQMTPSLIEEVSHFWTSNQMLTERTSLVDRAKEVVYIVRESKEHGIVGLSTSELIVIKQLNNNAFFLFRCIILPSHRIPGLVSKLINETRDTLQSYAAMHREFNCVGVITFVESPRVREFRRETVWPASQMVYIGDDKLGRHIRVYYFEGARI